MGDETIFIRFLGNTNARGGGAKTLGGNRIKNQARQGVMQVVLLIWESNLSREALVKILE